MSSGCPCAHAAHGSCVSDLLSSHKRAPQAGVKMHDRGGTVGVRVAGVRTPTRYALNQDLSCSTRHGLTETQTEGRLGTVTAAFTRPCLCRTLASCGQRALLSLRMRNNEFNGVRVGLNLLRLRVRDGDAKLLLQGHAHFHLIQGVQPQVLGEGSGGRYLYTRNGRWTGRERQANPRNLARTTGVLWQGPPSQSFARR